MHSLKDNNPENWKIFSGENLVIQCVMIESGKNWHPIHLVIKQVMMRSIKSNWAQQRSTGFKETKRGIWIFSVPICSTFTLKMQELTEVYTGISKCCKNFTRCRQ